MVSPKHLTGSGLSPSTSRLCRTRAHEHLQMPVTPPGVPHMSSEHTPSAQPCPISVRTTFSPTFRNLSVPQGHSISSPASEDVEKDFVQRKQPGLDAGEYMDRFPPFNADLSSIPRGWTAPEPQGEDMPSHQVHQSVPIGVGLPPGFEGMNIVPSSPVPTGPHIMILDPDGSRRYYRYLRPKATGPSIETDSGAPGTRLETIAPPRLRTQQACERCRKRKVKCSGDRPSCRRCLTRGFICEYAARTEKDRAKGPAKTTDDDSVSHGGPDDQHALMPPQMVFVVSQDEAQHQESHSSSLTGHPQVCAHETLPGGPMDPVPQPVNMDLVVSHSPSPQIDPHIHPDLQTRPDSPLYLQRTTIDRQDSHQTLISELGAQHNASPHVPSLSRPQPQARGISIHHLLNPMPSPSNVAIVVTAQGSPSDAGAYQAPTVVRYPPTLSNHSSRHHPERVHSATRSSKPNHPREYTPSAPSPNQWPGTRPPSIAEERFRPSSVRSKSTSSASAGRLFMPQNQPPSVITKHDDHDSQRTIRVWDWMGGVEDGNDKADRSKRRDSMSGRYASNLNSSLAPISGSSSSSHASNGDSSHSYHTNFAASPDPGANFARISKLSALATMARIPSNSSTTSSNCTTESMLIQTPKVPDPTPVVSPDEDWTSEWLNPEEFQEALNNLVIRSEEGPSPAAIAVALPGLATEANMVDALVSAGSDAATGAAIARVTGSSPLEVPRSIDSAHPPSVNNRPHTATIATGSNLGPEDNAAGERRSSTNSDVSTATNSTSTSDPPLTIFSREQSMASSPLTSPGEDMDEDEPKMFITKSDDNCLGKRKQREEDEDESLEVQAKRPSLTHYD